MARRTGDEDKNTRNPPKERVDGSGGFGGPGMARGAHKEPSDASRRETQTPKAAERKGRHGGNHALCDRIV